uniref:Kinesin-like protein n=1 Tax=Glossina austeni TaxID=7395 RepID=A0A1A9UMT1_GLOAU
MSLQNFDTSKISGLRDLKFMKRLTIPAKLSRLNQSSSASHTWKPANGPTRIGTCNSSITNCMTVQTSKVPPVRRAISVGVNSTVTDANFIKPASRVNATSVCTSAGKPINKRIPPYDFKARYNNLLERHKALKEKYEEKCEQIGKLENLPEKLEEMQSHLASTTEELKNTKTGKEYLQRQARSQQQNIELLTDSLSNITGEFQKLKEAYKKLKHGHDELTIEVAKVREQSADLVDKNFKLMENIAVCKEQLFRSNMERKELHNAVMDSHGNVRIFCRVRPPLDFERHKLLCGWNYVDESTVEIFNCDPLIKAKNKGHSFSFDQVFHQSSKQEDIFQLVSPLIQSALDGYNVCVFAYGQTGSGKTFTMDGTIGNPGVISRTIDLLFDSIKDYRNLGWQYQIKVQFLEIYNEVLYDLLDNESKEMEIRMTRSEKNGVYISNITQETVESADRLRQLMRIAKMNRATAATAGNERSSRSHAVTNIELIGSHAEKHGTSTGSINLVDLAGSESLKTSMRLNETKNINRSLSELTTVILALLQKQDHIPYRNSKLTHLLMPSLGGHSKTLIFVNVAPFQDCFNESLKSLREGSSGENEPLWQCNALCYYSRRRIYDYPFPLGITTERAANEAFAPAALAVAAAAAVAVVSILFIFFCFRWIAERATAARWFNKDLSIVHDVDQLTFPNSNKNRVKFYQVPERRTY